MIDSLDLINQALKDAGIESEMRKNREWPRIRIQCPKRRYGLPENIEFRLFNLKDGENRGLHLQMIANSYGFALLREWSKADIADPNKFDPSEIVQAVRFLIK